MICWCYDKGEERNKPIYHMKGVVSMSTMVQKTTMFSGMQLPERTTQRAAAPKRQKRLDLRRETQVYQELTGTVWFSSLGCCE